jgi:hypothetical protein
VAGDNFVAAQVLGFAQESTELQIAVTGNAGIWGKTLLVGMDKAVLDQSAKFVGKIEDMEGNPHAFGHMPCVVCVVAVANMQSHGGTDAIVTGLGCEPGGNAAVHTTAHTDHRFFCGHGFPPSLLWLHLVYHKECGKANAFTNFKIKFTEQLEKKDEKLQNIPKYVKVTNNYNKKEVTKL